MRRDDKLLSSVTMTGSVPVSKEKLMSTLVTAPLVHVTPVHVPLQGLPPSTHDDSADALPSSYLTCSSAS